MAPGATLDVYENPETPTANSPRSLRWSRPTATRSSPRATASPAKQRSSVLRRACSRHSTCCSSRPQRRARHSSAPPATAARTAAKNGTAKPRATRPEPRLDRRILQSAYALAVGGTTITDAAMPAHEHVWNDGGSGGAGGGGISEGFAMPSWQRLATVPGIDFPGSEDYEHANEVERRFGYKPGFCDAALHGIPAGNALPPGTRRLRPGRLGDRRDHRLQPRVPGLRGRTVAKRLGDLRRHLVGDADLGRHAGARRRLAGCRANPATAGGSASHRRCSTRLPPTRGLRGVVQ